MTSFYPRMSAACLNRRLGWFALLVGLGLGASGCSPEQVDLQAALSTPSGVALAGPNKNLLFISNTSEDTLQVLSIGSSLADLSFIESPAKYFPLRIKVGPLPSGIAATADGRFVLVLNALDEAVRVVDTDALRLMRTDDGDDFLYSLGATGIRPADMVAGAAACVAPCLGQFYVSLAALGQVLAFELHESTDGELSFVDVATYDVGGTPLALAAHPAGELLYVADAESRALIELSLTSGATELLPVGAEPGPISVSKDGAVVLVGRPTLQDVLLVQSGAVGPLAVLDGNPQLTPGPQCLNQCDQVLCSQTHPADLALCIDDAGLQAVATAPYQAVYVGITPGRIISLGESAEQPPLTVECLDGDSTQQQTFGEFAIVVGMAGVIEFIGLRDASGQLAPELITAGFCRAPRVVPLEETRERPRVSAQPLDALLDACPASLADRNRTHCVPVQENGGVVLFPGRSGQRDWELRWEGVLPNLDRSNGGGVVLSDGRLSDLGLTLADQRIQVGDLVEIVTTPQANQTCLASLGGRNEQCALERRVVAIERDDNALRFNIPLAPACFVEGASVAYRVRAGSRFLVFADGQFVSRLAPGQRLGPSGHVVPFATVMFQVQPQNAYEDLAACDRYDAEGNPLAPLSPLLSRAAVTGFRVMDTFETVEVGRLIDSSGNFAGTVGQVPTGAVVTEGLGSTPMVFVSFAGGDTLFGMVPFNTAQLRSREATRVIR